MHEFIVSSDLDSGDVVANHCDPEFFLAVDGGMDSLPSRVYRLVACVSSSSFEHTNETYPIAQTPVGQRRQPTLPGFGYFCSSFLSTGTSLSL